MKKRRPTRKLEDDVLWRAVTRTVTPRRPVTRPGVESAETLADEMRRLMGSTVPDATPQPDNTLPTPQPPARIPLARPVQHPLEERLLKRLARGRQTVDARIDLHGYTQDRARNALLQFLQEAQRAEHRLVLVITGKGERGAGVLRRSVPLWLEADPFARLINGTRHAHVSHGGEGALYVRIRRVGAR